MARAGSLNPDYNEALFPDERSPAYSYAADHAHRVMRDNQASAIRDAFHDRRSEGRRHTPTWRSSMTMDDRNDEMRERFEEDHPSEERQHGEWADKMMRAQKAEEGH